MEVKQKKILDQPKFWICTKKSRLLFRRNYSLKTMGL